MSDRNVSPRRSGKERLPAVLASSAKREFTRNPIATSAGALALAGLLFGGLLTAYQWMTDTTLGIFGVYVVCFTVYISAVMIYQTVHSAPSRPHFMRHRGLLCATIIMATYFAIIVAISLHRITPLYTSTDYFIHSTTSFIEITEKELERILQPTDSDKATPLSTDALRASLSEARQKLQEFASDRIDNNIRDSTRRTVRVCCSLWLLILSSLCLMRIMVDAMNALILARQWAFPNVPQPEFSTNTTDQTRTDSSQGAPDVTSHTALPGASA